MEMGSNLMQVDDKILALAQKEKRACSSIVYSLETLAWPQLHSRAQDFSMVETVSLIENVLFVYILDIIVSEQSLPSIFNLTCTGV